MIARDKLLHFIAGTYIYLFMVLFAPIWIAISVVIVAGFVKEFIWDKWLDKGCFEWMDIIYTITGGVVAMVLSLV